MAKRWWIFGVLMAIGCGDAAEPVSQGIASFEYASCVTECDLRQTSIAAGGARTSIAVTLAEGRSFASVKSTVPSVAQFRKNGDRIEVQSGVPGKTELILLDAGGHEIDRTWVSVDRAGRFDYRTPWITARPFVLEGVEQEWQVFPVRADGKVLIGTGAVRFIGSGPVSLSSKPAETDSIRFKATTGLAQVTAIGDDTVDRLEIDVAPAAAINRAISTVALKITDPDGTVHYKVKTLAGIAAGQDTVPVFGTSCQWHTTQPNLEIGEQTVGLLDSDGAESVTDFVLRAGGTYTATCTAGSGKTTVTLTR